MVMGLEKSIITAISRQVYMQFPEVDGKDPVIRLQGEDRFLLIYKGKSMTPNGRSLPRSVRVVADSKGKIHKMTTSR